MTGLRSALRPRLRALLLAGAVVLISDAALARVMVNGGTAFAAEGQ